MEREKNGDQKINIMIHNIILYPYIFQQCKVMYKIMTPERVNSAKYCKVPYEKSNEKINIFFFYLLPFEK
jgi:hypothetical protein